MFRVGVTIFKSISKWGIYFSVMTKNGGEYNFYILRFHPKDDLKFKPGASE